MNTKAPGKVYPLAKRNVLNDNKLITARYRYTTLQKKILYLIFEKMKFMDATRRVQIHISELFPETVNQAIYTKIKTESKKLRDLAYNFEEGGNWHYVGVIGAVHYFSGKGVLEFEITDSITPYVKELKGNFTTLNISHLMSFKSVYSQRIYENLCRFRDTGIWSIHVSDLRFMFDLEHKYRSYNTFKKNVIITAQRELEKTDLSFAFREIKTGKKITTIQFRIKQGQQHFPFQDEITEKRKVAKERLEQLRLSSKQINIIMSKVALTDIYKTIHYIKNQPNVMNLGAYTWTVFTEHYKIS